MNALTIGIAGGSGSGKSTIANKIIQAVGADRISVVEMDCYYKDLTHLGLEERKKVNFDHPSSLDINLFLEHIVALKNGKEIKKPHYDFMEHTRKSTYTIVKPHPVIILEGILLYENAQVREQIDIKTFVETPSDMRFTRRLIRDIKERGRSPESVVKQYLTTVRPMYKTFTAPTKEYADIIIPWQGYNEVAVDMVISRIESTIKMRRDLYVKLP